MSSGPRERFQGTLGLRLAAWYAGLFIVGALALFALSYALLARSLEQRDHEAVRLTLAQYASTYETSGAVGLLRTLGAQEQLGAHVDFFVRVIDRQKRVVFLSLPGRWTDFDLTGSVPSPLPGTFSWSRRESQSGAEALEIASMAVGDGTILQVGRSTRARREVLGRFRELLGAVLLATILLALAVGIILTQRALRPVRDLARTVGDTIRTARLDARVPEREGGDALDELVRLVNAMLDRIERLVKAMHGSLDAVAHDLRTPLMRLRVAAESALTSEAAASDCREALSDTLEEAERLRGMLDSLMDLSEAEAGVMALRRERIPVTVLFEETRELFADLAEDKGITLRVQEEVPAVVDGDRNRLRQVLANLVDNAIKYTTSGGEVALEGREEDHSAVLEVIDTGAGIDPGDLPRIWDRLFRGDRSRSERGLGLGLSLVRAIVEAHGGQVAVESAPGHGSRFTVRLPAAS
ncbi:MAG: two-component sensor histidine kinase [Acidobacteria bacterium]|jgi:heavy metal sensor kinase|nr:two-component sensor histidine kinase [Acidobacteriota bacterium]